MLEKGLVIISLGDTDNINLVSIAEHVAQRGKEAIAQYAPEANATLDYLAIFSQSAEEFERFLKAAEPLGDEVDKAMLKTGHTFRLHQPMQTSLGAITYLKIRKPDKTRPQRGAPDFVVSDYEALKATYLSKGGNFTLMLHPSAEMMELKGDDVLVYLKAKPFSRD